MDICLYKLRACFSPLYSRALGCEPELLVTALSLYIWTHHFGEPELFPAPNVDGFVRQPRHVNVGIVGRGAIWSRALQTTAPPLVEGVEAACISHIIS